MALCCILQHSVLIGQCDRCPSYQLSDRLFYSEGDDIVVRFITNQNTSVLSDVEFKFLEET
ncbi:hypothetical protein [Nostoc sp.]|uniref:hypothetical protein n=1 Tax=Nostoc sp. TaxID=1180 RepID=UPI002FFB9AAD